MIDLLIWPIALYHYEMWIYDLGWIAIDGLHAELSDYWDSL